MNDNKSIPRSDYSIVHTTAKSVVSNTYSYLAFKRREHTIPYKVMEYIEQHYSDLKLEIRHNKNAMFRENLPPEFRAVHLEIKYKLKMNGVIYKEYSNDKSWSVKNVFCRHCWDVCQSQFEYITGIVVEISVNPHLDVLGCEMCVWPIDYVCNRCDEVVFEIVESQPLFIRKRCECPLCIKADSNT